MPARILFLTGKGGTGKSTIARALAAEAVAQGRPALVISMPPSSDPRRHARVAASHRPAWEEKTLDEKSDLEAFLNRVLGFRFLARRLQSSGTFAAVAAAAPGLRDLVALAAVAHEARRRRGLVIVDAPSSGHSAPMLEAPRRVLDLAPFGPAAGEARRALALLVDPRSFVALLIATPEELAITEVLALRDDVAVAGVAASNVIVNGCWPAYVNDTEAARLLAETGSSDVALHWQRHVRQRELVALLEETVGPCVRLPFVFDPGHRQLPREAAAALLASLDRAAA
ncbi:MAG TPA: ArsA-related P-loop ATPase [Candidatus Binatia bacterium]